MDYVTQVEFWPVYELVNSIHTYICKKSGKKIELGTEWSAEVYATLSPELRAALERAELDNDWKLLNLLLYLCPDKSTVEGALLWLEQLSVGEMYETLSGYVSIFPAQMNEFRSRMLFLLTEWNRQYFSAGNAAVLSKLHEHAEERKARLSACPAREFVDETTNGFVFLPVEGLRKLVLIPQFHFQPVNIIYNFGSLTLCHYAARINAGEEEISPSMYKALRSLSEKSRLKILKSLGQERRTFSEIARSAGISKGIVHDHVFSLRCAGLLHAYIEGEAVTSYSLRLEGVRQMNTQLLQYLSPADGT
ncbi:ArsR/SmtB family transcription factor [Paenibacillus tepidiphilus]|uniref:ArsR/SmtB family transcription factor n=1 Tax=Paenibacillus tepidiphilus TaxID=2608683 RepID=UPI00123C1353|nr:winged helix-turn-helix domain-containing protein [Paenibacillus tepidiphilus]